MHGFDKVHLNKLMSSVSDTTAFSVSLDEKENHLDLKVVNNTTAPIMVIAEKDVDHQRIEKAFRDLGVKNTIIHSASVPKALDFIRREGDYKDIDTPRPVLIILEFSEVDSAVEKFVSSIKDPESFMKRVPIIALHSKWDEASSQKIYSFGANVVLKSKDDFQSFYNTLQKTAHFWMHTALMADISLN